MSNQANNGKERKVDGLDRVLGRLIEQIQQAQQFRVASGSAQATPTLEVVKPRAAEIIGEDRGRPNSIASQIAGAFGDQQVRDFSAPALGKFFLSPILTGVLKLFTRGTDRTAEELKRFERPTGMQFDRAAMVDPKGEALLLRKDALGNASPVHSGNPTVQISIQALDARSILDRSGDIAQAVRQAMLSNHEINGDLGEL